MDPEKQLSDEDCLLLYIGKGTEILEHAHEIAQRTEERIGGLISDLPEQEESGPVWD